MNNDVGLRPGSLREIATRLRYGVSKEEKFCAWAMVGEPIGPFPAFVLTQLAVQKVGFGMKTFGQSTEKIVIMKPDWSVRVVQWYLNRIRRV